MSKFRAPQRLQSKSEEAFILGAEAKSSPSPVLPAVKLVAESPQPSVVPGAVSSMSSAPSVAAAQQQTVTTSLRLTLAQHEQVKALAAAQGRSMSDVLRRVLSPALEEAARELG